MQIMARWRARRRWAWPYLGFAAALVLYGAAGAPAPPGIRVQEALVFAGIASLVGLSAPWRFFSGWRAGMGPLLPALASLVLILLLWQGLVRGLWNGWGLTDMGRDIVPMLFLSLPLLLGPALARLSADKADFMADAAALGGVAFAARWWVDAGLALSALGSAPLGEGRDYLLNSAMVPFAAVWLTLRAASFLSGDIIRDRWVWMRAGTYAVGGLCCLLALAATVHRAGLGLSLLALAVGLWRPLSRQPLLFMGALILLMGLGLASGARIAGVMMLVADKTESVGLNNRIGELLAVLDQVGRHPVPFLFGDGWGALVANPAVGYWRVSYTHSAASYFLLKVGAVGLLLIMLPVGLLAGTALRAAGSMRLLLLSVAPSLLLGAFLHTSFKYLCYSLLVSLVAGRLCDGLYNGNDRVHPPFRDEF